MNLNETWTHLCLSKLGTHGCAGIKCYPVLLTFDHTSESLPKTRRRLRAETEHFIDKALIEFLIGHGYADTNSTHSLLGMGWFSHTSSPLPQFSSPREPTCALIVCLPNRERAHECFKTLVNQKVGELVRACSIIKNIQVDEALEGPDLGSFVELAVSQAPGLKNFILVEHHLWFDEWNAYCEPH